jgi:HD-like signal output (HDOD) protein
VLKTVNSPWFGLENKIGSVNEAVSLLGINNLSNICVRIMLRASLESAKGIPLERFWDSATDIAAISRSLANRLGEVSGDDAYTLGLLHDCGIPLLMRKFSDYRDVLKIANDSKYKTGAQVEDERYRTDHTTVGYFICKSWRLPQDICEAVRNHHNQEIWRETAHPQRKIKSMIGIVQMAEKISHAYRVGHSHLAHAQRRDQTYHEWENIKLDVFDHFSLSESAYHELHADMVEELQENA